MSRQYKKSYDLTVIPVDGDTRVIKDLRINFEITKSVLGPPNLGMIEIYNPNPDTLAALQNKFTKVILNAGYEGNVRLIFKGDIRNVLQMRQGPDRIATVYAADGDKDWKNSTFNKTFAESVSIKSAIDEVLASFSGLTIGPLEGIPDEPDKLMGQTLSGSSKDIMDVFADQYGFNWNIQDGEMVVTPIDQPLEGSAIALINSATGMIGSPTLTEIGADVTTLLNPSLMPNTSFKIESQTANVSMGNLFFRNINKTTAEGTYKIQESVFKGDTHNSTWFSVIKGRSINV